MKTEIKKTSIVSAEMLNDLYEKGYRFITEGNYKVLKTYDAWSGMPNVEQSLFAFDDKEEAEAFAKTQKWVFDKSIHPTVKEIPEHTETWEESKAREEKAKAERKARKEANELKKATALGMTVAEYRAEKKRIAIEKELKKEIAELEKELERKRELLKKYEKA